MKRIRDTPHLLWRTNLWPTGIFSEYLHIRCRSRWKPDHSKDGELSPASIPLSSSQELVGSYLTRISLLCCWAPSLAICWPAPWTSPFWPFCTSRCRPCTQWVSPKQASFRQLSRSNRWPHQSCCRCRGCWHIPSRQRSSRGSHPPYACTIKPPPQKNPRSLTSRPGSRATGHHRWFPRTVFSRSPLCSVCKDAIKSNPGRSASVPIRLSYLAPHCRATTGNCGRWRLPQQIRPARIALWLPKAVSIMPLMAWLLLMLRRKP